MVFIVASFPDVHSRVMSSVGELLRPRVTLTGAAHADEYEAVLACSWGSHRT